MGQQVRRARSGSERIAHLRAQGRRSLVWDPEFDNGPGQPRGAGVRPDEHEPTSHSYSITRCAHCRPAHAYDARWRKVRDDETDLLSLGMLRVTDLAAAAARHLDAQVRAVTVPPPPAPVPPRPRRTR